MKKKVFFMISAIVTFIILVTIATLSISENFDNYGNSKKFNEKSLGTRQKGSTDGSVFCLNRGMVLDGMNELNLYHTVKIVGIKAYNLYKRPATGDPIEYSTPDDKKNLISTDKANAKLAYIAHVAKNEGVEKNVDLNNYGYSKSQNAMWYYFHTWYNANKQGTNSRDNGIRGAFGGTTSPRDEYKNIAKECMDEAEEYYKYLTGKSGGVAIKIDYNDVGNNYKIGNKYYTLFAVKVTKQDNKYIKTLFNFKVGQDNLVLNDQKNEVVEKGEYNKKYYIAIKNPENYNIINAKFSIEYEVKSYNAKLKLYYYQGQQRVAVMSSEEETGLVPKNFTISREIPKVNISLQKFIVEYGEKFDQNTGKFINRDENTDYYHSGYNRVRESRMAYKEKTGDQTDGHKIKIHDTVTDHVEKNAIDSSNETTYKINNPVKIKTGYYVTYRIDVYNNSDIYSEIYVKDTFENGKLIGIYDSRDASNLRYYASKNYSEESTNDPATKSYKWKVGVEGKNHNVYWLVVKYDSWFPGRSFNEACLEDIENYGYINETDYRTLDYDYVEMATTDVSLQKYITKINGNELTYQDIDIEDKDKEDIDIKDRVDYMATPQSTPKISTSLDSRKNKFKDYILKSNNVVNIGEGDHVTYAITVYNNDTNAVAKNVKIIDELPFYATGYYWGEYDKAKQPVSLDNNGEINIENGNLTYIEPEEHHIATKIIDKLDKGAEETVYITVVFDKYFGSEKIIKNSAELDVEDNTSGYRLQDEDYVQMNNKFAVSLEKYITKVTDINDRNVEEYNQETGTYQSRENKRYNSEASTSNNKNPYKNTESNYVRVEPGDKVTYTIKLTNTGKITIMVSKIQDIPDSGLSNETVKDSDGNNIGKYENNMISLNSPIKLSPGESKYITIVFKVDSGKALQTLTNVAKVPAITDIYGIDVTDSDGEDNNQDQDTVITKTYAVSLEKYITKVTDINDRNVEEYNQETGTYLTRENRRYNSNATTSENQNPYKNTESNYVRVEPGDKVTYTIKLTNTREDTTVWVNEIADNPDSRLVYDGTVKDSNGNNIGRYENNIITLNNPVKLSPGESNYITIVFKVNIPKEETKTPQILTNIAEVTGLKNRNDVAVTDSDGTDNNRDQDTVKTKTYAVSLKKYISAINGVALNNNTKDPNDHYAIASSREANPEDTNNAYEKTTNWDGTDKTNTVKYDNPVTVNKGDFVTYTIKLVNDSTETKIRITELEDKLPEGIDKYIFGEYNANIDISQYYTKQADSERTVTIDRIGSNLLDVKNNNNNDNEVTINITVRVCESNMSTKILRNTAEITQIRNRNTVVKDTTEHNNFDADYIQLNFGNDEGIISGTVWNDKALNKQQDNYNGLYNSNEEKGVDGVAVKLYRVKDNQAVQVADTTTKNGGVYSFADKNLYESIVSHERYIKGPKNTTNNRWAGTYYSYYVVFEYDGVTYTSTPDGTSCVAITDSGAYENGTYQINSNAKESDSKVDSTKNRSTLNNTFGTINNAKNITYKTTNVVKNGAQFSPESKYQSDSRMNVQSATEIVQLKDDEALINQIRYINLGLRGKDLFDLSIESDVKEVNVTVNQVPQRYEYTNVVTVRRNDLLSEDDNYYYYNGQRVAKQDSANNDTYLSKYENVINDQQQGIRSSDINNTHNYVDSIDVTYVIKVNNEASTKGTATKVTNYYDSYYEDPHAYASIEDARNKTNELNKVNGASKAPGNNDKYGYVTFDTEGKLNDIENGKTKEIYVVYKLTAKGIDALKNLSAGDKLPTYNMSEIYEYKSIGDTYTRGLIDKDSAPGSANREQARTTNNVGQSTPTINANPTTVEYYFNINNPLDLTLKLEDDTFKTPTFYLLKENLNRELTGAVFEDSTKMYGNIKSGDGIKGKDKDGNDEKGIEGATVTLHIDGATVNGVKHADYNVTVHTYENGMYRFEGFVPGKATLTFQYGDTKETFLVGDKNSKSYNGEDFESTNNTGKINGVTNNKLYALYNEGDYWYINNEGKGVSVATDKSTRRSEVSNKVSQYSDDQLSTLNQIRSGDIRDYNEGDAVDQIRKDTMMTAYTTKAFTLEVEKADTNGRRDTGSVEGYEVYNMNFGIAEVPVTTIDLKTSVKELIIIDAAGDNIIAKVTRKLDSDGNWNGEWNVEAGNVLAPTVLENGKSMLDVSIEEQKLQGARLKITYEITANQKVEKDFNNNTGNVVAAISGLVDYVDNDLSYNASSIIGKKTDGTNILNSEYWEVTTYDVTQNAFKDAIRARGGTVSDNTEYGIIDPKGTEYTTILKAKTNNPLITSTAENVSCDLVLEKVLSAHDMTLENVISSTIDTYDYENTVEITGVNYDNTRLGTTVNADRVRTPKLDNDDSNYTTESWMTILPATNRFGSAISGSVSGHPPTGDSTEHNNTVYYIVAISSLTILATGVVLIRKYAIKKA